MQWDLPTNMAYHPCNVFLLGLVTEGSDCHFQVLQAFRLGVAKNLLLLQKTKMPVLRWKQMFLDTIDVHWLLDLKNSLPKVM